MMPAAVVFDTPQGMSCAVEESRKLRATHTIVCQDAVGHVAGAVLDRRGRVVCQITGAWDPASRCYLYSVCDVQEADCQ